MKSASPDIKIEFGPQAGSPAQLADISNYVVSDVQLGGEGLQVEGTAYGHTSVVNQPIGVEQQPDVTLEMFFDDDDDKTMELFGEKSGRDTPDYLLKVTYVPGSPSSYAEWPCAIKSNPIRTKVKDMTRILATLTSRGPVVFYRQGAAI